MVSVPIYTDDNVHSTISITRFSGRYDGPDGYVVANGYVQLWGAAWTGWVTHTDTSNVFCYEWEPLISISYYIVGKGGETTENVAVRPAGKTDFINRIFDFKEGDGFQITNGDSITCNLGYVWATVPDSCEERGDPPRYLINRMRINIEVDATVPVKGTTWGRIKALYKTS